MMMELWNDQNLWSQFILASAISVDTASVAIAMSVRGVGWRAILIYAGFVGGFHAGLPLISGIVGRWATGLIGWIAGIFSGLIFTVLGLNIFLSAFGNRDTPLTSGRWWQMGLAGFFVSVDALTVGFSMGMVEKVSFDQTMWFGISGVVWSLGGWAAGKWISYGRTRWTEAAGGAVLFAYGMHHLLQWF